MRRLLIGGLVVALLLLGALIPVLLQRPSPVTRAAYERIEEKMSREAVELILGGPPGDYRTRPVPAETGSGAGIAWEIWMGDEGEAWVSFEDGVVRHRTFMVAEAPRVSAPGLVLWRLGRLKDRVFP